MEKKISDNDSYISVSELKNSEISPKKTLKRIKRKNKRQLKAKRKHLSISANKKIIDTPSKTEEDDIQIVHVFLPPIELEENLTSSEQANARPKTLTLEDCGATTETYSHFKDIFDKYFSKLQSINNNVAEEASCETIKVIEKKTETTSLVVSGQERKMKEEPNISRRKRRLMSRLPIVVAKEKSTRPETIEIWDLTAPDPLTLINLKSCRNSVPVPCHWSQKRKYLQGKRGIEKPQLRLPEFIEATGIGALRKAYCEKEARKETKAKGRERVRPKMNSLDINYEILRDAFFTNQTKPHLTRWGELYYEGKEFELPKQNCHPGFLSDKLKKALGMDVKIPLPPPWLINMQRYGPPPSFPSLKIPGLNSPIPEGCRFGYGIGEWGKAPVDQSGQPLYGDVFTDDVARDENSEYEVDLDKTFKWGKMEEMNDENMNSYSQQNEEETWKNEGIHSTVTPSLTHTSPELKTPNYINMEKKNSNVKTLATQSNEEQ